MEFSDWNPGMLRVSTCRVGAVVSLAPCSLSLWVHSVLLLPWLSAFFFQSCFLASLLENTVVKMEHVLRAWERQATEQSRGREQIHNLPFTELPVPIHIGDALGSATSYEAVVSVAGMLPGLWKESSQVRSCQLGLR